MERIKWEEYFMAQSHLLALRSTCQRLSVGATIVKDNRIIAGGYNGSVAGEVHCIDEGCLIEDGHCIRTIHAEMNALLQCAKQGVSTEGATIVKDNRIIAGGYNGSVAGEVHCIDEGCLIEDGHCIRTIHAEM
ncbi:deaminase, partial [Staphylococcus aureus]|uniref:deaminase n=1 Tax=Staphylococcus aureus TaxID=1280 RepID=UPI001E5FEA42